MANIKLNIAFWDYDRSRALADGSVKIDGVEGSFHSAAIVTEIFRGMIAEHSFDVSELGLTYSCVLSKMDNRPSSPSRSSRIVPFVTPPSSLTKEVELIVPKT